MDRCYFAKEPPDLEIRGGLVFLKPKGTEHCEIAITPATLDLFVVRAKVMLAKWKVDELGKVVPIR